MAGLNLNRPTPPRVLISLVPMIDVLLILLVFFMVTSTYLNLDMIPAVRQTEDAAAPSTDLAADVAGVVMVRLGSDGIPVIRGQAMSHPELGDHLLRTLAEEPLTQVVVLPSAAATTQALISVMDTATRAGAVRLRVIRLEVRP